MGFIKDTLSIFKKNELAFVKKYVEADRVYTFLFEKPEELYWSAGQHGLFTITHKKIKDSTRPFSVASSSGEDHLKITTVIQEQPSEFKKALLELEEGMTITMSGPVGSFYLKDGRHSLLIACGIGITPFRAILKQLEAEGSKGTKQVKLLYLDSVEFPVYKSELDKLGNRDLIDIAYFKSARELYQEIDQYASSHGNSAEYYVAGSKSAVDGVIDHLKDKKIAKRNIKKDAFTGY
jgi:ferredoxin-NADP reductase